MATAKVLGNYELLQQILLNLPLRQLLLAQEVNKAWYDVVQRSQEIRKTVFLLPSVDPIQQPQETNGVPGELVIFNPFLDICNIIRYKYKQLRFAERGQLLNDTKDAMFIAYGHQQRASQLQGDLYRYHGKVQGHAFICRRPHRSHALGSRGEMQLAHPRQTSLVLRDYERARTLELAKGLTYGALMSVASRASSGDYISSRLARTDLPPTGGWLQFSGSLDTITGFQMLEMLERDVRELQQRGVVFRY